MNQFKNGTLVIVIATIVTVVLILVTGRDTINSSKDQLDNTVVENETSLLKASKVETTDMDTNTEKTAVETPKTVEKSMGSVSDNIEITAPKAPEGPFNKSTDELANSENNDQDKIEPVVNVKPNAVITTSKQHDLLNHIVQPIWMDQKLGDFKSLEKGDVIFKIMPTTPNGLQGEDPERVVTAKSDKFAPTTVSADYNYQQMPMYNGGYYIAPMPSYLMRSVVPKNIPLKNQ